MAAAGSKSKVRIIKETSFGVTPATPTMQELEYVSFTGDPDNPVLVDNSISAKRQVMSARRGNVSTAGSMAFVLSSINLDWALEAVLQNQFASDVLKAGQNQPSFTVEQEFSDVTKFRVFRGVVIDTLKLTSNTDNYVTGEMTFMGSTLSTLSGTSIASVSTPLTPYDKIYHEGGTFLVNGSTAGYLTSIEFEIKNSLAKQNALGVTGVRSITAGKLEVTGTIGFLFEDETFYNLCMNDSDVAFKEKFVSGTKSLEFLFPKMKLTKVSIPVSNDGVITGTANFNAVYDATSDSSIVINRDNT